MDRRTFTLAGTVSLFGLTRDSWPLQQSGSAATPPVSATSSSATAQAAPATKAVRPPALSADMVKEFVGAAHVDLEKTKSMLAAEPGLVNATWDWGGGDFEQAIGGAGHMGRKDIADFLISQGARMDIFVAAMLGDLDLVQSYLKAQPHQRHARGPHGIPLLVHAQMGAKNGVKEAADVIQFLQSLPA
jgi:hypothetical protein